MNKVNIAKYSIDFEINIQMKTQLLANKLLTKGSFSIEIVKNPEFINNSIINSNLEA
jgi:hypothetical protein